jgi:hypothetical protein
VKLALMLASVVLVLLLAFVLFEPRQLTVLWPERVLDCAAMLGYLLIALWRVLRGVDLPSFCAARVGPAPGFGLFHGHARAGTPPLQGPQRRIRPGWHARSMHMTRDADVPSRPISSTAASRFWRSSWTSGGISTPSWCRWLTT